MKQRINLLREFSIPLLTGVLTAMVWANISPEGYRQVISAPLAGGFSLHFLSNEIFMVFFFAIAAVEITQSCLPGGDLHPLRKAVTPLIATVGGVIGPVAVYCLLNSLIGGAEFWRGWGIPTATDIAFAWLAARLVLGGRHPVIPFLLLLAIADDAIGLIIIALFYADPTQPAAPVWLFLTLGGMVAAWLLRRCRARSYWPYLVAGGVPSWVGLHHAHLHPALALVVIVPFLPHPPREQKHLFEEDPADRSTLAAFEHEWKVVVDFGLFFFGFVNAGVPLASLGTPTWLVLFALLLGKGAGIWSFGAAAEALGFPLPKGVTRSVLLVAAIIAGIGFTVALFVAGEAFVEPGVAAAARMGAMLSSLAGVIAWGVARLLKVRRVN